jgi:adenine phosphoribosyltransferase
MGTPNSMPDRRAGLNQVDPSSDPVLATWGAPGDRPGRPGRRTARGGSPRGWHDDAVEGELRHRLRRLFRWTDPGTHSTYLVSDRSGWWRDPVLLDGIGPALAGLFGDVAPTVVVAPEVTGFLVGPLVARALGVGFVEAYKGDRWHPVAEPMTWSAAPADHRGAVQQMGVRSRHLSAGDRALVVDDWLTTGAQVRAVHEVVAALGAEPVGTAVIVAECDATVAAELRVRSLLSGSDL